MKPILNVKHPTIFSFNREPMMDYFKNIIHDKRLYEDYHIIFTETRGIKNSVLEVLGLENKTMSKRQRRLLALKKIQLLKGEK